MIELEITLPSIVVQSSPPSAGGDMLRSVYDNDLDGVVNDSQRLAGQLASYYATAAQLLNIDTNPATGPREISIGAADADVIRIGNSGSQVLLIGDVFVQDINNVAVQNKLADLNAGAPANSGSGVGFNVIENDVATGWFKTNAGRTGWLLKSPTSNQAEIFLSSLSTSRQYTLPDESGQIALLSQLQAIDDSKENAITAGEAGQYWDGEKTWRTLNAAAVGLDNVPNINATDADNIQTNSGRQFVNDSQILTWNGKQDVIVFPALNSDTLTATVTWTAGTQPSGTTDHRISVRRIGNMVVFMITLDYATAGATMTSLTISNLNQLPNPATNTNFAAASMYIQPLQGRVMTTSKSANALNISPMWRVNAANNGFEIVTAPTFTSGAYRFAIIHGIYYI